jgi:muramoyltetrapeptide carboxypeptidase
MCAMPVSRDILKPRPLRRGDKIGIVAPASNVQRNALDAGLRRLQELGYQVELGDSVFDQDLYFAGSREARVRDLMEMFRREDIRAIICARGGYGSNYLLPLIDLELVRRHPKVFVGYSDLTALLTWIHDETGLVTFHGPMVAKDFAHADGVNLDSWFATLEALNGVELSAKPLSPGEAEGTLYGGCLSILVASLGTPYEIETGDTILFLEDIGVKPYQLDRMLMQLIYAGKFEGVRGVVFGAMQDCLQPGGQNYTLEEVILRVLGGLNIPVAFGLPSGHVPSGNITLPFGIRARLQADTTSATLSLLESAVSAHSHTASIR